MIVKCHTSVVTALPLLISVRFSREHRDATVESCHDRWLPSLLDKCPISSASFTSSASAAPSTPASKRCYGLEHHCLEEHLVNLLKVQQVWTNGMRAAVGASWTFGSFTPVVDTSHTFSSPDPGADRAS